MPPAYRVFDDHGNVLVLRSDMTVPIARVVATRYADAEPPLRFCYVAHAYRQVRPHRGQMRELLQAGVELIGAPAPDGHRRGARRCCAARWTRPGCATSASGSATASLVPARCSTRPASGGDDRDARPARAGRRATSSASSARSARWACDERRSLLRVPQLRGGPEVLDALPGDRPARRLARGASSCSRPRVRERVDLRPRAGPRPRLLHGRGLRGLRPGLGAPLGGGGRYDELLGPLRPPAAGGRLRARRRRSAQGAGGGAVSERARA